MSSRLLAVLAIAAMGCSAEDADRDPDATGDLDAWYASMPRCPDEVVGGFPDSMMNHFPMYPMSYVDILTGAEAVPSGAFEATWTGIRRLDPPIVRDCLPAFVTDPPGIPCRVDTVIQLALADGMPVEVVAGLAFEELEPLADGRAVTVLLGRVMNDLEPDRSPGWSVEIREAGAGPLLVAVRNVRYYVSGPHPLTGVTWSWDDIELAYGDTSCVTEQDPCQRVFASRPLVATSPEGVLTLEPGEGATVASGAYRYRVTHRRAVERLYHVFRYECADLTDTTESVALIRLP
ncbi:MAG: hypothetical protein HY905_17710 [Deltaproteobacteria bacterium]|nr:hypothetical protein [Deltaproteobacteria bacterium]